MSTETTETTTEISEEQEAINQKFAEQSLRLSSRRELLERLERFFQDHKDAFAPFEWKCYGFDNEITFDTNYSNKGKAKEIATAFGKDGWTRHKDRSTCGQINWKKEVAGVVLLIEGAEHLSPKLIEEVKL